MILRRIKLICMIPVGLLMLFADPREFRTWWVIWATLWHGDNDRGNSDGIQL